MRKYTPFFTFPQARQPHLCIKKVTNPPPPATNPSATPSRRRSRRWLKENRDRGQPPRQQKGGRLLNEKCEHFSFRRTAPDSSIRRVGPRLGVAAPGRYLVLPQLLSTAAISNVASVMLITPSPFRSALASRMLPRSSLSNALMSNVASVTLTWPSPFMSPPMGIAVK